MTLQRKTPIKKQRPDAFDLGPKAKTAAFLEMLQVTPQRTLGRHHVYLPADRAPFILSKGVNGKPKRRNGEIRVCEKCGKDYFWMGGARPNQRYCSHACAGDHIRRSKHRKAMQGGGPKKEALDTWFSLIVRSVGHCQRCGTTERLQCAHVVSRRYLGVRFDFRNAMCLCAGCHMYFTHRPLEWEAFVIERMGEDAYWRLKRRALAFRPPLNRVLIAQQLYAAAEERDLSLGMFPGWPGWTDVADPEADEADEARRQRDARRRARLKSAGAA